MRLLQKSVEMSAASVSVDCLYHIRAVSVLSIYTYVGNAGMRKELRQMHVAVTDEETASPEYESAYADYKKTYGGMYDTLDMRKILEQKEKRVDMNRKEPGECGLCAIMTGCRSGWNRSENRGRHVCLLSGKLV